MLPWSTHVAQIAPVAAIDRLKPGSARREIPDAGMPGLYLVLQATGAKSWAVRYRTAGRTRKLTVGPYPRVGLAAARERARHALEAVDEGRDPGAEHLVARAAQHDPTLDRDAFATVARAFIERYAKPRNRTWAQSARLIGFAPDLSLIPGTIAERWATRDVHAIRRRDVLDALDAIVDRGAPAVANRTLAAVRKRTSPAATMCSGWAGAGPSPATVAQRLRSIAELALTAGGCTTSEERWPRDSLIWALRRTSSRPV